MQVYVYEHVTGGGLLSDGDSSDIPSPLLAEAVAMTAAITQDLRAIDGVEVLAQRDVRLKNLPPPFHRFSFVDREFLGRQLFNERAAAADGTLLIAPETDGILTSLARRVEAIGGELVSPASEFCAWASDKSCVAATMQAAGVPMPRGILLSPDHALPKDFLRPALLKPNDGCGSQGIRRLTVSDERVPPEGMWRCEEFVPGAAVSVALMRGPNGVYPLPACAQRLADDGSFAYLGGSYPLKPKLAERAERLARRVAAAMPDGNGYLGLDLVLGPAEDGSQDYLIEVNPRLTTSYVGLRAACETNLAQAMLDVVAGRTPRFAFNNRGVDFDSDGTVRYV